MDINNIFLMVLTGLQIGALYALIALGLTLIFGTLGVGGRRGGQQRETHREQWQGCYVHSDLLEARTNCCVGGWRAKR